jgi:SAM-dependent methyltransferase
MKNQEASNIDVYLDEYTRDDIIARYISQSAGAGIAYVLTHVYAPIYIRAIDAVMADSPKPHRMRVLEYGCGGGMNLLKFVELLRGRGAALEKAFGTDFSPPMIEAARKEAAKHLPPELNSHLVYAVAGNEELLHGLARSTSTPREQLEGTFDIVVGVNTSRYCHRLKKENESTRDLFDLLKPGGYSVMIDMNRDFPFFRSKVRNTFKPSTIETYVPSLSEYKRPFAEEGFIIKESRNFCWVPHSASPALLPICRGLAPILDTCFRPFAMRSLVVAQKPR